MSDVVEMVELAGLRGDDVRRLSELLTLSSWSQRAGPGRSPCQPDSLPTLHPIPTTFHALVLG